MKVGAAFSQHIYSHKYASKKLKKIEFGQSSIPHMRTIFMLIVLVVACLFLFGRIFFLQILNGDDYRVLSDSNRTRTSIIHAPRGVIFDRNGKPLVFNIPGFREVINGKTNIIDDTTARKLLAQSNNKLEIDSLRDYPYKDIFAHVIGYTGQISQDELSQPQFQNYGVNDIVGKMGIEEQYESDLRGTDGKRLVEVDATGKQIRVLGETDPIPGKNLTLTLDTFLQETAYNAMKDVQKGAVVISKPDGEILALVSKPSFDPNLFTQGEDYHANTQYTSVSSILTDGNGQPLLNRAIAGEYPPGSTFKLIMAAAGLQTEAINKDYTIQDTGVLQVGNFSFANWYFTQYGKTEPNPVNVVTAIQRSNDIFFYKLGELLGVDKIAATAQKFGVGQKLGIDIPGERAGLMPTKEWKQKTFGEQWYLGDDYHLGIGQGYLLTTPLQVNAWTQAIANGGTLYQPHVLKNKKPLVLSSNLLSPDNFDLIRQGMVEACNTGGVGWPLFGFKVKSSKLKVDGQDFFIPPDSTDSGKLTNEVGVSIACKTGTAQQGNEAALPHAWITLFAPAYNPQIVVTVLAESSGEGSNVAGPIAKQILESYFSH